MAAQFSSLNDIANVEPSSQPRFEIQRIYMKEQSCKVPNCPMIFAEMAKPDIKPDVHLEMNVKHERLEETVYQVVLTISVTSKIEQRMAFVAEVHQAGIFKIENIDDKTLRFLLEGRCPGILIGYARKNIADATMEAGFAPLTLVPIDFEGMYAQRQQAQTPSREMKTSESSVSFEKTSMDAERVH